MINQFSRTEAVLGKEGVLKLKKSKVAVFGLGGVGGYAVEALVRSGIGEIDIIDSDVVSVSNLNRQIIATYKTIGMKKTDAMEMRIKEICPDVKVNKYDMFYLPENSHIIDFAKYDYVVDAIDTVTAKVDIIIKSGDAKVPVISCMGTGNKLSPQMLKVEDIYKTSVCPLARRLRGELKKRGVKKLKVVYSQEIPVRKEETKETKGSAPAPGSTAFVPPVAGLLIAAEVIKDLTKE